MEAERDFPESKSVIRRSCESTSLSRLVSGFCAAAAASRQYKLRDLQPGMEIALQDKSNGILYEGYHDEFIQCIFEDGDIAGRNERYEFRCDSHLACCGRSCCVPQEATIPLWLMIVLIFLAVLMLLAILAALAWMCSRRKPKAPKPKKVYHSNLQSGGYRAVRQIDDDQHVLGGAGGRDDSYGSHGDNYSTLNRQSMSGYGNRAYNAYDKTPDYDVRQHSSANTAGALRVSSQEGDNAISPYQGRQYSQSTVEGEFPPPPPPMTAQRGFFAPPRARHGVHETFEESYKEEIQMERSDSREYL
ncbi:hypothetical protein L596_014675 [Steinernema carpocapsae]|uniref:CX domain-containing protein n=1 Tax=Steinernema carpocapsae TaxID=34508 RepID=A0A4U5NDE7_STECR|nr:hypothetical protein L596_014675 [Steinernema carpocapsae]